MKKNSIKTLVLAAITMAAMTAVLSSCGKDDEPIVCEVNSNPHFKSSLDCTGVDMSPLILSHIKERVQKR